MDNINSIMIYEKSNFVHFYEIKFEIHFNNEFKPHYLNLYLITQSLDQITSLPLI